MTEKQKRCKKAKKLDIANCGPIKEEEDYCLFHKLDKSEEEAEKFYAELRKQRTKYKVFENVAWAGYVFPTIAEISFFKDATFKDKTDFRNVTFEDIANFQGATFENVANFKDATFKDVVNFEQATFEEITEANFQDTTFEERAEARFQYATFKDMANFQQYTTFEEIAVANFQDATFEDMANFWNATFKDVANFQDATFKERDEANFQYVTFKDVAEFANATFEDMANFQDASFGDVSNFADATFKETAEANFENATFSGKAIFTGSTFNAYANFEKIIFERTCNFEGSQFKGRLSFAGTDFRQGIMMEEDWEKPEEDKYCLPQAEQEGCRVQRLSFDKEGKREATDVTFVREMQARRRTRTYDCSWYNPYFLLLMIINLFEKVFLDLTCKYGTNWKQLIASSMLVIFAFSGLYQVQVLNLPIFGKIPIGGIYNLNGELIESYIETLYFSIITFSTLGYGDLYPIGLIRFVAGFQSLLGAFFISLFVVVFARKWMR